MSCTGGHTRAEDQLRRDGFEPVHVEHEWHDGPWAGIADVDGVAHYFRAVPGTSAPRECLVWPVAVDVLDAEREQWTLFVAWNARYESGAASVETHPGRGGDARYRQLEARLRPDRAVPPTARRMTVEWRHVDRPARYGGAGPDYLLRWRAVP